MTAQSYHAEPDAITRQERDRVNGHTRWICEACGWEYESPIRVLAVTCSRTAEHAPSKSIAMRPVTGGNQR